MNEAQLLQACLDGDGIAQRQLYEQFAGPMLGVCMRYTGNKADAEDVLQEGFIKVFQKLNQFKGSGNLGGWIRTIMINTALEGLRKNNVLKNSGSEEDLAGKEIELEDALSKLSANELQNIILDLPDGYRQVFNLYAVEGYNHREIGEMLNISAGTSKSQYSRAKVLLQQKVEEQGIQYNTWKGKMKIVSKAFLRTA